MEELIKAMALGKSLGELLEAIHELKHSVDGLQAITKGLAEYTGIPKGCREAEDKPLKVGDILYCRNGERKAVLEIGYKWAILSITEKLTEEDGIWYEPAIKAHRFSLDKDYAANADRSEHFEK